jgi:hypothetical protein
VVPTGPSRPRQALAPSGPNSVPRPAPTPRPSFPPPEGGCTKRATASRRPTGQCSTP